MTPNPSKGTVRTSVQNPIVWAIGKFSINFLTSDLSLKKNDLYFKNPIKNASELVYQFKTN